MKVYINKEVLNLKNCKTIMSKTVGLMGKKKIKNGIVLFHCNSIHTFFMKTNIDVIMTDKHFKVLYIYKNLSKNKIILPKKNAYYTFELPANKIQNVKINQYLKTED